MLWIQFRSDPELFGYFKSGIIVPDPDQTILTKNLYNFYKFFFKRKMVQFVFVTYIFPTKIMLTKFCSHYVNLKFANYLVGRIQDDLKVGSGFGSGRINIGPTTLKYCGTGSYWLAGTGSDLLEIREKMVHFQ